MNSNFMNQTHNGSLFFPFPGILFNVEDFSITWLFALETSQVSFDVATEIDSMNFCCVIPK